MDKAIAAGLAFLVLSLSVPSAQAFSLDGISQSVGLLANDVVNHIKLGFMGTQAWFFLYIMNDSGYHSYIVGEMEKTRAYHSLNRQRASDPTCCKPAECIIHPEEVCVTMCIPCNQVEQELIQHFNNIGV